MTRRDALDTGARRHRRRAWTPGFDPVKVNVVLMRGVNDDEIVDFATFGRERGVDVRFIEFMPLDARATGGATRWSRPDEIVAAIDAVYPLEPVAERGATSRPSGSATVDGEGEVGVIASVTRPFCGSCDRVRLTAEGQFRNCLFAVDENDLRAILRGGGTDDDLAAAIERRRGPQVGRPRHRPGPLHQPERSMSQIGGVTAPHGVAEPSRSVPAYRSGCPGYHGRSEP